MASKESHAIEKLNNHNFNNWKFKIQMLLIKEELNEQIINDPPDPITPDWNKKDNKARALINLTIDDSQIVHVRNLTTAKQTWDTLTAIHERKNLSSKLYLLRSLYSQKLDERGNMPVHINKILEIVDRLKAIGEDISDSHISALLLCSLPQSYDTLVTALEARPEDDLTPDFIRNKLMDEHTRRCENHQSPAGATKAFHTQRKNNYNTHTKRETKYCGYCRMKNHNKQDCWHLNKNRGGQKPKYNKQFSNSNPNSTSLCYENEQNYTYQRHDNTDPKDEKQLRNKLKNLAFATGISNENHWIVDSGSSSHITNNEKLFTHITSDEKTQVIIANGNALTSYGSGDIDLKTQISDGTVKNITLKNVLYVPELETNLLSVRQATSNGCKIIFEKENCKLTHNNETFLEGKINNNLYEANLHAVQNINYAATVQQCTSPNCITLWHRRMGHKNVDSIKLIKSKQLAEGININDCKHEIKCETCIKTKMTDLPYPKVARNRGTGILERIHSDVCGPMPVASLGGKHYFVTFIDDYSRYSIIYLLAKKSEVLDKLKEFISYVSNKFGKIPKILRSDQGGEYEGDELNNYLKELGIHHERSVAHCSPQNGVAERKNRTLVEMTRSMLSDAKLNMSLWGEAVNTANHLQNRLPTKATDRTPYELWTGKRPNLSDLKIFGCKAYAFVHKTNRNKLQDKGREVIFVGYDNNSKGYRVCSEGKYVTVARSVRFLEQSTAVTNTTERYDNDQKTNENTDTDINGDTKLIEITIDKTTNNHPTTPDTAPTDSTTTQPRRSERTNKGVPPDRLIYLTHEKPTEPETYDDYTNINNPTEKENWLQAMKEEISSLQENKTYELVDPPPGRKIVGCKWTYKIKCDTAGNIARYKARLVAKGFSQKYGEDYHETFAPVVSHTTIRAFLAGASHRKTNVHHIDVKTAFLHGELEECIYMQQPQGFISKGDENKVCKMKKAIYGLKQAARAWHLKIGQSLKDQKFVQSTADPCLFKKGNGPETVYLIVYVDDILITGSKENINQTITNLKKEYEMTDLGQINQYLGMEIMSDKHNNFRLSQKHKIDQLTKNLNLQNCKPYSTPMDTGYITNTNNENTLPNNRDYRKAIGALLYIATVTRPDIAAATSILSRKNENPTQNDWNAVKRLIGYLYNTRDLTLLISGHTKPTLVAYADADWGGDKYDRKSQSGNIFFLGQSPIHWISKKQTCVALSSAEAEYVSAGNATQEILWLKSLLKDLDLPQQQPVILYEDNQSCIKMIELPKYSSKTKHIDIKLHAIRNLSAEGIVKLVYLPTKGMVADILTKPLPKPDFLRHREQLLHQLLDDNWFKGGY